MEEKNGDTELDAETKRGVEETEGGMKTGTAAHRRGISGVDCYGKGLREHYRHLSH